MPKWIVCPSKADLPEEEQEDREVVLRQQDEKKDFSFWTLCVFSGFL